ncbi:MAG: phosphatidylserine decarboxylase family protein [candidate division Zixibacteria bacterium]|nr:phosphatidylserine decarboxylase family protein [candidate division Zixibacteria bacterium]
MERDGWRFVMPALVVGLAGLWLVESVPILAWPLIVTGFLSVLAFAFFFRDPERNPPDDPGAIVATSDGTILEVESTPDGGVRIDTFLSVWNVHVNRAPVAGTVTESRHQPGAFAVAHLRVAGSRNERHDLVIESALGPIRSAQIAGILARRIVCRARLGDVLGCGERIGLIRFGSRAQVFIPAGFDALVRPGSKVRGGVTVIARRGAGSMGEKDPA